MKTEKEVKEKLRKIRNNKSMCKTRGNEIGYVANAKIEKILKWILKDSHKV